MKTTIFVAITIAALGAVGITTAIMSSATPARAVDALLPGTCGTIGTTNYCAGGLACSPACPQGLVGGRETFNPATGEFTTSGGSGFEGHSTVVEVT